MSPNAYFRNSKIILLILYGLSEIIYILINYEYSTAIIKTAYLNFWYLFFWTTSLLLLHINILKSISTIRPSLIAKIKCYAPPFYFLIAAFITYFGIKSGIHGYQAATQLLLEIPGILFTIHILYTYSASKNLFQRKLINLTFIMGVLLLVNTIIKFNFLPHLDNIPLPSSTQLISSIYTSASSKLNLSWRYLTLFIWGLKAIFLLMACLKLHSHYYHQTYSYNNYHYRYLLKTKLTCFSKRFFSQRRYFYVCILVLALVGTITQNILEYSHLSCLLAHHKYHLNLWRSSIDNKIQTVRGISNALSHSLAFSEITSKESLQGLTTGSQAKIASAFKRFSLILPSNTNITCKFISLKEQNIATTSNYQPKELVEYFFNPYPAHKYTFHNFIFNTKKQLIGQIAIKLDLLSSFSIDKGKDSIIQGSHFFLIDSNNFILATSNEMPLDLTSLSRWTSSNLSEITSIEIPIYLKTKDREAPFFLFTQFLPKNVAKVNLFIIVTLLSTNLALLTILFYWQRYSFTKNELENRERQYRLIAENSIEFIYQIAPDGTLTYCSPAIMKVLGYSPKEVVGTKFVHYMTKDYIAKSIINFNRAMKGQAYHFHYKLMRKDGEVIDVHSSSGPLRDEEGKIIGTQGIMREANSIHYLSLEESEELDKKNNILYLSDRSNKTRPDVTF